MSTSTITYNSNQASLILKEWEAHVGSETLQVGDMSTFFLFANSDYVGSFDNTVHSNQWQQQGDTWISPSTNDLPQLQPYVQDSTSYYPGQVGQFTTIPLDELNATPITKFRANELHGHYSVKDLMNGFL